MQNIAYKLSKTLYDGLNLVSSSLRNILIKMCGTAAIRVPIGKHLVHTAKSRPFTSYSISEGNIETSNSFEKYSSYEQIEYICNIRHTTVLEPVYGFVVTSNAEYYRESLPYCDDLITPIISPNIFHVGKKYCVNEAVSIRYGWNNYWHFCNDALGTLSYLHDYGVSQDIPIIIPELALQYQYVREVLMEHSYFKNLNFIFQARDQWIECKNIWFGKVLPNTKDNLLRVNSLIDSTKIPAGFNCEKIFLTRRGCCRRKLSNIAVIEGIAEENGFSVLDTAQLDVAVQKAIFKSAKVVIGIHGAGLTNLLFACENKIKVLEIFSIDVIPPHYFWLSRELGYEYRALLGSVLNINNEFALDENRFYEEVIKL